VRFLCPACAFPARPPPTRSGTSETVPNRWGSSQRIVALIDGRWTLALLAELLDGGRRYQELDDALDGVSHKVLTDTLRRAERDGLIARQLDPSRIDTATLYQLTDLGRSLNDPLAALARWAESNWPLVEEARRRWSRLSDSS
jgi:DNA-binding HxlR family transcriptional regulator